MCPFEFPIFKQKALFDFLRLIGPLLSFKNQNRHDLRQSNQLLGWPFSTFMRPKWLTTENWTAEVKCVLEDGQVHLGFVVVGLQDVLNVVAFVDPGDHV